MKNKYRNLHKIEFVMTYACTGNCKHCSQGDHKSSDTHINGYLAAMSVKKICLSHCIDTVMCFGGEPLLFAEDVCRTISAAKDMDVFRRQVITNGYFTTDTQVMREVARELRACGVTDLLLSADAFHQETIPLEVVTAFAKELKAAGVPTRIHPAWLVSNTDNNPYNVKTWEIVDSLCALGFDESKGNVIFCEGNAKKYLASYFEGGSPQNPYIEDPEDIRCISLDCYNIKYNILGNI